MAEFPGKPYILFGHSMGSFMARTVLSKYPDCGIAGCVICGTAWQEKAVLAAGIPAAKLVCKLAGETKPSAFLHKMAFGSYNDRIPESRTSFDWLSRDNAAVDRYAADPLCGFIASAGLMRDMMMGIGFIQKEESLAAMNQELPVLFTAGEADPVGNYSKGVLRAAEEFRKAGMKHVEVKLYPGCRHEILNEIGREEIFRELGQWISAIKE